MQLRVLQDNLGPLLAVWPPPIGGFGGRLLRLCIQLWRIGYSSTSALAIAFISGAGTFFGQGGLKIVRSCQRLGGEAPQTPLFPNARFYEQDTQQTYFDRHQLHARSSDRNFFRIIFYRGKQDCLLPLGFSNHARITTHVFVKCKYLNHKTKK